MGLIHKDVPLETMDFQWWNPTRIIFGNGKVRDLPDDLDLDWNFDDLERVFVVTDKGVRDVGHLDYLLEAFKGSSREIVGVYDGVLPDAESAQVYEIAREAADVKPDIYIALGGGSVMDACKAAAVLEKNGGDLEDYAGMYLVPEETSPIICIPTTSGTGSEVTWGAVIKDEENRTKIIVGDYKFAPKVAVLDPELTKSLPAHLVVATGLDALTHAIGALVSVDRQDVSSAISLRVVEMVADNLEKAYHHNSTDLVIRSKMLIAAMMAGIAFQTALPGADHGIGHTAGALFGLHHGLAVGIANLYVMEYNMKAVPHIYASVARALGVKESGLSDEAMGMKAIEVLRDLYQRVGVKLTFKEYGCPTDDEFIDAFIEQSLSDATMGFNPVGVDKTPEFERLIKNCIGV